MKVAGDLVGGGGGLFKFIQDIEIIFPYSSFLLPAA